VCSLRPGVPGVSDNIQVRSVMGRFLEHSRVFYFHNAGQSEVYISSADWMPRNFFRRVEIATPVDDPVLRARVIDESLERYLADNTQAWVLQKDGSYRRLKPGTRPRSAQESLLAERATLLS
jgi:polyphosphate kinase